MMHEPEGAANFLYVLMMSLTKDLPKNEIHAELYIEPHHTGPFL